MGPLKGVKVLEIASIGPGPFAAMMLSDMGAEVLRIDRIIGESQVDLIKAETDLLNRGRKSVSIDLKNPAGVEVVLRLVEGSDLLIEGFRPGVMERLGLGPEVCLERNPSLVYGRVTGWGQEGPLARTAGHDINYIALAGVLSAIGRVDQAPVPPLNLLGDFGGGGMLLAFGVVCALLERTTSGEGQVVDAAMVDGAALLMTMIHALRAMDAWNLERGTNLLDTGAPFYETYECRDGEYISVGSLEPQFYDLLIKLTGLEGGKLPDQMDRTAWPALKDRMAQIFKSKTREEWCEVMEGTDVCFAPVLSMTEAPEHPHLKHRGTYIKVADITQPAPAPRFSRTAPEVSRPPSRPGQHTEEALLERGFTGEEIAGLREHEAIA
ncbi:MAG TPA: CoA transferase [Anaerolineae bacterium]|nr:CoA transferase [Anaerolineae bacterium]